MQIRRYQDLIERKDACVLEMRKTKHSFIENPCIPMEIREKQDTTEKENVSVLETAQLRKPPKTRAFAWN
jgi:hypothetical protein